MNGVTAHGRDLLDMIDFRPLLEKHNHDTVENLKGTMYNLYHWCPIMSADELVDYLSSRYPDGQLQFGIQEKTNAYRETYMEYTIRYSKNNLRIHTRKAFKKLISDMIDHLDDEEFEKVVSDFVKSVK